MHCGSVSNCLAVSLLTQSMTFANHHVYIFLSFFNQTYPEEHIEEEEQVFDTTAHFCPFLRHCKLIVDEKDNIISGEIFGEVCE